jgi:hypothetical protein
MKQRSLISPERELVEALRVWQAGVQRLTDEVIAAALAVAEHRQRLAHSERVKDGKANLRLNRRHQGGRRPFGYRFGKISGPGRAPDLIPDLAEQQAIRDIVAMREAGRTLMGIRDIMRERGFKISHQAIANIMQRRQLVVEAAE